MALITTTLLGQTGIKIDTLINAITKYTRVIPLTLDEIKQIAATTLEKIRTLDLSKILDSDGNYVGLGSGGIAGIMALERDFQISTWFNDAAGAPTTFDALVSGGDTAFDNLINSISAGDNIVDSIGKIFPEFSELASGNFIIDGTVANAFLDSNGEIKGAFEVLMEQFGSENLGTLVAASEIIETSSGALADLISGGVLAGLGEGALGLVSAVATTVLTNLAKITGTIWTSIAGRPMDYASYEGKPIIDSFIKAYPKYLSNSNNWRYGLFGQGRDAISKGFWKMISMMVRDFLRTYSTQYVPSIKMFITTNLILKQLEAYNDPSNKLLTQPQKDELNSYMDGEHGLLNQFKSIADLLDKLSNNLPTILNYHGSELPNQFNYALSSKPGSYAPIKAAVTVSGDLISLWIKECLLLSRKIAALYSAANLLAGSAITHAKQNENNKVNNWATTLNPEGTVSPPQLPEVYQRTPFPTMPQFPIFNFFPTVNLNDLLNRNKSGSKTDTTSASASATDTTSPEEKDDNPDKIKKKKKKKKIKKKERLKIQYIRADVTKYSKWLKYIDFKFEAIQKKEANKKGTVTITLKNEKEYIIGTFKRGVYSNSVVTLIGAGYGYWRNFNYKNLVNKNTISYNLPRPSLHRQLKAISKEIKLSNITYS